MIETPKSKWSQEGFDGVENTPDAETCSKFARKRAIS